MRRKGTLARENTETEKKNHDVSSKKEKAIAYWVYSNPEYRHKVDPGRGAPLWRKKNILYCWLRSRDTKLTQMGGHSVPVLIPCAMALPVYAVIH